MFYVKWKLWNNNNNNDSTSAHSFPIFTFGFNSSFFFSNLFNPLRRLSDVCVCAVCGADRSRFSFLSNYDNSSIRFQAIQKRPDIIYAAMHLRIHSKHTLTLLPLLLLLRRLLLGTLCIIIIFKCILIRFCSLLFRFFHFFSSLLFSLVPFVSLNSWFAVGALCPYSVCIYLFVWIVCNLSLYVLHSFIYDCSIRSCIEICK